MEKLNKPRTKSDTIRHARKTAASMKSRSATYRRMENWKEEHVGSPEEKHTITLKETWSFEPSMIVTERTFDSVPLAMRGISMTYPCREILARDSDRQELVKVRSLVGRTERALDLKNKEVDFVQGELDEYAIDLAISDMCLEWASCELERVKEIARKFDICVVALSHSDECLEWANCDLEREKKYSGAKKLIRSFGKKNYRRK